MFPRRQDFDSHVFQILDFVYHFLKKFKCIVVTFTFIIPSSLFFGDFDKFWVNAFSGFEVFKKSNMAAVRDQWRNCCLAWHQHLFSVLRMRNFVDSTRSLKMTNRFYCGIARVFLWQFLWERNNKWCDLYDMKWLKWDDTTNMSHLHCGTIRLMVWVWEQG